MASVSANLLDCPAEILEDIFRLLDGKTFYHLRTVCKRSRALVDYILEKRYKPENWRKLCLGKNFLVKLASSALRALFSQ